MEAEMDVENDSNALNVNKSDIRKTPIKNDCNVKPLDKTENKEDTNNVHSIISPKLTSNLENNEVVAKKIFKTNSDDNNITNIVQSRIAKTQNEKTQLNSQNDTFLSYDNDSNEAHSNNLEYDGNKCDNKIEVATKSTKTIKRVAIFDSDSDSALESMDVDEAPETSNGKTNFFHSDEENSNKSSGLTKIKPNLAYSKSDENSMSNDKLKDSQSLSRSQSSFDAEHKNSIMKPKRSAIFDSDEDDEGSRSSRKSYTAKEAHDDDESSMNSEKSDAMKSASTGLENDESNSFRKPKRHAILDSDEDDETSRSSTKSCMVKNKALGAHDDDDNSMNSEKSDTMKMMSSSQGLVDDVTSSFRKSKRHEETRKLGAHDDDDSSMNSEKSDTTKIKSSSKGSDDDESNSFRKPKRRVILDSDEDDESSRSSGKSNKVLKSSGGMGEEEEDKSARTKPKKLAILDSDSEEDNPGSKNNLEITNKLKRNDDVMKNDFLKSRWSNLCDSESSEEEREDNARTFNTIEDEAPPIRPTKYKKKPKKEDADKPKKMNAKEAAEQRKEIESESQRMMRERHVSLPYHRPKQRSLKEFLQQRSRFASAVPNCAEKASPSLAIKMSKNQIMEMTKKIEEREKEVQEFFKSESEESEDENEDKIENEASTLNDNELIGTNDNKIDNDENISKQYQDSINNQLIPDDVNDETKEEATSTGTTTTTETTEKVTKELNANEEDISKQCEDSRNKQIILDHVNEETKEEATPKETTTTCGTTENVTQELKANSIDEEEDSTKHLSGKGKEGNNPGESAFTFLKQGEEHNSEKSHFNSRKQEDIDRSLSKHGEDNDRNLLKHREDDRNLPKHGEDNDRNLPKHGEDDKNLPKHGEDERNLPKHGEDDRNLPKHGEDNDRNIPKHGEDYKNLPKHGEDERNLPKHGEDDGNLPKHGEDDRNLPKHGEDNDRNLPKHGEDDKNLPKHKEDERNLPKHGEDDRNLPKHGDDNDRNLPKHGEDDKNLPKHKEDERNLPKHGEDDRNLPKHGEDNDRNLPKHGEDDKNLPKHKEDERNLPKHGEDDRNLPKHGEDNDRNLPKHGEDDRNLPKHGEDHRYLPKHGEDNRNLPRGVSLNLCNSGEENSSILLKQTEENMCSQSQNICCQGQNICSQSQNICSQRQNICSQTQNICSQSQNICSQRQNICSQGEKSVSKLEGSSTSQSMTQIEEKENTDISETQIDDGSKDILGKPVEGTVIPPDKCITILRIDTIRPGASDENAMECQDLEDEEIAMDFDVSFDELEEEPKENHLGNKKLQASLHNLQNPKLKQSNVEANNLKEDNLNEKSKCSELKDTFIDDELQDLEKNTEVKKLTRLELLKQRFGNTKPKLSGGPNFVIDLEEGVTKPSEVSQLMERFMQHTSKKKQHKSKIELSVVSVTSGGDIHQEKLAVKVDDNEEPEIIEKPGVKLKKLRDELQQQMAERRSKLWQQRLNRSNEEKVNDEESVYKDEKSECGAEEDNLLDNEEEEELTDPESSEDEIDDDDDTQLVEKKRPKCDLLDEEAEVDDEEELEEAGDDEVVEINEADDEEEEDDEEEVEEDKQEESVEIKKKTMRRIIQNFNDDDDSEEEVEQENVGNKDKDLDSTDPLDDDYFIPPGQPRGSQTPARQRTQTKSDLLCLTPVIHLTGLQSLNSGSKFLHESPGSPAIKLTEPSPLKGNHCQKKLLFGTQPECNEHELEALAELCSGKFPTQTQPLSASKTTQLQLSEDPITTQDLADLCSGQFTGISGIESRSPKESAGVTQSCENIELQTTKEVQSLIDDDDDKIITQLLNEEELQEFKKKFESPIVSASQSGAKVQTPGIAARIDFDSGEDDDEEEIVVKKRKQHAIVDSDDENDPMDQEEEINLHDDDDSLDGEDPEPEQDEFNQDVEYDSEENEIDVNSTDAQKKVKLRDFFENEAELSDSEWGSADEDEKDLDTLDIELGDQDKFDQDKVRKELEKIHMRQVLAEDSREIKLLQELLLEDGELHGAGRQKQFRWKNVDMTITDNADAKDDDDNIVYDDEIDEEEWRKKRYEREIFLREQTEKGSEDIEITDISLAVNSQIFKLGQKTRIKTTNSQSISLERTQLERKVPFSLLSQRGSFLARPEQDLQRVAEYTKPASTSQAGVSGPKRAKHYIFQKISSEPTAGSVEDKKRKAAGQGTPIAIKKLRLDGLSPAEKPKADKNTNRVKRLFSNW